MGFVATPESGRRAVELGVQALARLSHRGGLDADGKSGDGAGLLIQVPRRLLGGDFAVAALFEWDERARDVVAEALTASGMKLVEWRKVPLALATPPQQPLATMPPISQRPIAPLDIDPDEFEPRLYMVRLPAQNAADSDCIH